MEKRIFGAGLTIMGIIGLIYAARIFANGNNYKQPLTYSISSAIFFFSGIGLIRTTRDRG